jgi:FAD/FMN-containing dehydrogenase
VTLQAPDWETLEGGISGEVLLPGSPGYEPARKLAIARFHDARPRAVVLCETAEDVSEAISFARRQGLRAVPRSGGHCFAERTSVEGVVIDVSPMCSVSVSGGVATVGAGARLGQVYDALDEHGLTIAAGCGPDVGIAGLTLGGGLGILGRKYGLTSDQLLGARVVLADGSIVECDEDREADLFWALRGSGGGNFGVVTSLAFRTVPAPAATAFDLIWPHAYAPEIVGAWQVWSPAAPDELAASLHVFAPDDPDQPPAVSVSGSMLGTTSDARGLLDEFVARAGVDPTSVTFEHASYRQTKSYLAEHGPGDDRPEGHPYNKSEFFREPLPAGAVRDLLHNLSDGRRAGQSRELDFTPWAGAYNRVSTGATAFAHRDERFLLLQVAVVESDAPAAEREAARDWLARSWSSLHPWGAGRVYPNFPDPDLEDWAFAYHGTNLERLAQIKAKYDPDGFFHFHQSIPGDGARA